MANAGDLANYLMDQLRKELVESQRIRAQIIGFKITFVSAGIGLVAVHSDKAPACLLAIPAFAAIFFDVLITSYSFSIKRTGHYIRTHLEPILAKHFSWPDDILLWEAFMKTPAAKENLSLAGNLGITVLAAATGVIGLFAPSHYLLPISLRIIVLYLLMLFLLYDLWSFLQPRRFGK